MDSYVPDDEKVGNASDGVPAPFLRCVLLAESREQTSENHDEIRNNSHTSVRTIDTSQKTQIKEKKRSSNGPVNVTSIVHLAAFVVVGAGQLAVVVLDTVAVEAGGITGSHGEVGDGGGDGDESGDDVVETGLDGDLPGHGREDGRGGGHDDEDGPKSCEAIAAGGLVLVRSSWKLN